MHECACPELIIYACDTVGNATVKSCCLRIIMVNLSGWINILKLFTDAYVCMGGFVRIYKLLTDAYMGEGEGLVNSLAYEICGRPLCFCYNIFRRKF